MNPLKSLPCSNASQPPKNQSSTPLTLNPLTLNTSLLQSLLIHGDGSSSRDFTYIDNVVQMNHLAATTTNPDAVNQVFNTAAGERTDLNQLTTLLKKYLSVFDTEIINVPINQGPNRKGDIPHSLASIEKAEKMLGYKPEFNFEKGLKLAVEWYWKNLKP